MYYTHLILLMNNMNICFMNFHVNLKIGENYGKIEEVYQQDHVYLNCK